MTRQAAEGARDVLQACDLRKFFSTRSSSVEAVCGVSMSLREGEVLAFLGSNGAGKTTCIKMVSGLVRPDVGMVRILGRDPHAEPRALAPMGVVLEGNRNLYWRLSAEENLEYFGVLRGLSASEARRRGSELLHRFGLRERARELVQTLSRGMQQRLAIAVALVHRPRLLLLDEPTLGLDVEAAEEVKRVVRELTSEGCAVLLTTHQLDVAQELAHRVIILHGGRIVAEGSTDALLARFSAQRYVILLDEAPSAEQRQVIETLGAEFRDKQVTWPGPVAGLYQVLQALAPLSLVRVEKDHADLTEVFLRVTRAVPPAEKG